MEQIISPIISPGELVILNKTRKLVMVDARTGVNAQEEYLQKHLKGALFVNLDTDLADIKSSFSDGGRHPLPDPVNFSDVLTKLGITPSSHVIIYDTKNAANAAARFWWMLKSIGHEKVQVIDGGFDAAIHAGFPISSEKEEVSVSEPYGDIAWRLPLSNMQEIENVSKNKDFLIIDVREKKRYDGDTEPIDLVAGHIPGAINIPYTNNLDNYGFFLSPEKLKKIYEPEIEGRKSGNLIVHCGSGVTACHTILAMDYAGMQIPKLYVGSWSEWSRNDKPVETSKSL